MSNSENLRDTLHAAEIACAKAMEVVVEVAAEFCERFVMSTNYANTSDCKGSKDPRLVELENNWRLSAERLSEALDRFRAALAPPPETEAKGGRMSKFYIGKSDRSGISINYVKSRRMLDISGWYDGFVGIEGEALTLREFFDRAGITMEDCQKAFLGEVIVMKEIK